MTDEKEEASVTEREKEPAPVNEEGQATRAVWQRPELRRLDVRDAENTGFGSTDNFSQTS